MSCVMNCWEWINCIHKSYCKIIAIDVYPFVLGLARGFRSLALCGSNILNNCKMTFSKTGRRVGLSWHSNLAASLHIHSSSSDRTCSSTAAVEQECAGGPRLADGFRSRNLVGRLLFFSAAVTSIACGCTFSSLNLLKPRPRLCFF